MSVKSEQSADGVFEAIRELVKLRVGNPRFWGLFVKCVAGLCRASVCRVFRIEDGGVLELGSDKGKVGFPSGFKDRAVELTERLAKRDFIFEPFSLGEVKGLEEPFILVFRVDAGEEMVFAAVITEHKDVRRFNEVVVRSQLMTALCGSLWKRGDGGALVTSHSGSFRVLEVLEEVSSQKKFKLAGMRLVDEIAFRYRASRVGLGWIVGRSPKAIAISGIEKFEKNSEAISEQTALFEECIDQGTYLNLPEDQSRPDRIVQAHKAAMGNRALSQVVSVPVFDEKRVVGVLTLEFSTGELQPEELEELLVICDQSAKWLSLLHSQERKGIPGLLDGVRNAASWWLGPRNTLTKLLALVFVGLVIAGSLIRIDFKFRTPDLDVNCLSLRLPPLVGVMVGCSGLSGCCLGLLSWCH